MSTEHLSILSLILIGQWQIIVGGRRQILSFRRARAPRHSTRTSPAHLRWEAARELASSNGEVWSSNCGSGLSDVPIARSR